MCGINVEKYLDSSKVKSELFVLELKTNNPKYNWLTNKLTPWSRVLFEKLRSSQLVKRLPAFYGNQRFITAFTTARHLPPFRVRPIQYLTHPTSWRSTLILSSYLSLRLPSVLFPSGFLTKTLYAPHLFPVRVTRPAHQILLDLFTRIFGEECSSEENYIQFKDTFCRMPCVWTVKVEKHLVIWIVKW